MFKNSGAKLKIIAIVVMIVQMIACIVGAIVSFTKEEPDVLTGILLLIGGFFAAWFEALTLHAIGVSAEAAERTQADSEAMAKRLDALERKLDLYFVESLPAPEGKKKDKKK